MNDLESVNMQLDQCSECSAVIQDEDYIIEYESHEFWGTPCNEVIVIGYTCRNCGYMEEF